jgi:hypothetical protein
MRVAMNQFKNPTWWDISHDFAWDHVKLKMKHDWNQIINSLGGNAPDPHQNVVYDPNQENGISIILSFGYSTFEELEPAFRFGYGARMERGLECPEWNDNLEICLAHDWRTMNPRRQQTWEQDRHAILFGWNFEDNQLADEVNCDIDESFRGDCNPLHLADKKASRQFQSCG